MEKKKKKHRDTLRTLSCCRVHACVSALHRNMLVWVEHSRNLDSIRPAMAAGREATMMKVSANLSIPRWQRYSCECGCKFWRAPKHSPPNLKQQIANQALRRKALANANDFAKMANSLRTVFANGSLRTKFASDCECDGLVHSGANGYALRFAPPELKGDREIVMKAVCKNADALHFATEELRGDREIVLQAISKKGDALAYATEGLRGDREIVIQAVSENGHALQYATEGLRGDHEIVMQACEGQIFPQGLERRKLQRNEKLTKKWRKGGRPKSKGKSNWKVTKQEKRYFLVSFELLFRYFRSTPLSSLFRYFYIFFGVSPGPVRPFAPHNCRQSLTTGMLFVGLRMGQKETRRLCFKRCPRMWMRSDMLQKSWKATAR